MPKNWRMLLKEMGLGNRQPNDVNKALHATLLRQMQTLRNPERAAQQQAYMKSSMPFWGIAMPQLRQLCKAVFRNYPLDNKAQWHKTILHIWDQANHREEKHAAIELLAVAKYRKAWLEPDSLTLLQHMIQSGAWWDYVDPLAINNVGFLLQHWQDKMTPRMEAWAQHEDLWIRRSAILSQLKFKGHTDESLLCLAIDHSIDDKDFFARKAIGWALREYAKTNPGFVVSFVNDRTGALSGLSKREAYKGLLKQGVVSAIP